MFDKVLPSTDNFFKYLLTVGVILVFFAILYPLQKQQDLDLAINEYKKNVEVYDYQVEVLAVEANSLESLLGRTKADIQKLDSLRRFKIGNTDSLKAQMVGLKEEFDSKKAVAVKKGQDLKQTQIAQKFELEKINKLQSYLSSYFLVKLLCIIVGTLLFILGLWFWASSTYLDEKIKVKDASLDYQHSYIKCCDWISTVTVRFKKHNRDNEK